MANVRIYIPATSADISRDSLLPRLVHAVTPKLERVMLAEEEVLESVAMNAAADDSLRVLSALSQGGETIRPLRVVVAADVPEVWLAPASGEDLLPTALHLSRPVPWDDVASIHVDDEELLDDLVAAIAGDEDAFERVADEDLMWYDVDERQDLLAYFG